MPLDPSIPLQVRGARAPANPLELAAQAFQVRDLALRGQAAQRAQDQQRTIADLYRTNLGPDGTPDAGGVTRGLAAAGFGDAIPAATEQIAKAGTAATEQQKANLALHVQKLQIINSRLTGLAADPDLTHDKVIAALSDLVNQGVATAEEGAQAVRALPGPQGLRRHIIAQATQSLNAEQQLRMLVPQYNEQDRGGVINQGTVDPMTGTRTAGADVAKTETPDQAAKNAADARKDEPSMSAAAIDLAAHRLLNGEKSSAVVSNLGRGRQGVADIAAIQNRFADLASGRGMDARDIATRSQELAAEGRARTELGAREGKIAPRVVEAKKFAQIAIDASGAVPRDKFMPWNQLSQMADSSLSDPSLAKLKAATVSLINAYAAAVGGGQIHVHDQETAGNLISQAMGPEAYKAVANQLITETEAALEAPGEVKDRMRKETGGTAANGAGIPTSAPAGSDRAPPSAAEVQAFVDKGYPPDVAAIMAKHGAK